jgi:hypothetical protein
MVTRQHRMTFTFEQMPQQELLMSISRESLCICLASFACILGGLGGCSGRDGSPQVARSPPNDTSTQAATVLPASVVAWPGASCGLHATGETDPQAALQVFADDFDGIVRFTATRAPASAPAQPMTMECQDETGKREVYSFDLRDDEPFQARPLDTSPARFNRPALAEDPLSYSPAELLKAGYGLRPPATQAKAYSDWLAGATRPAQIVKPKKLVRPMNFGPFTSESGGSWAGAVLTGNGPYILAIGTINGMGDPTGNNNAEIAAFNGIGGFGNNQLIQSGVAYTFSSRQFLFSTFHATNQFVWREFCCGEGTVDNNGNNTNGIIDNTKFVADGFFNLTPGHSVFVENWTCNRDGTLNASGGFFGCSFVQDTVTGQTLSCVSATDPTCPSLINPSTGGPFVFPFAGGTSAEFIVEPLGSVPTFSSNLVMSGSLAVNSSINALDFGNDSGFLFATQQVGQSSGISPFFLDTETILFPLP